jgi:hypothetical protein
MDAYNAAEKAGASALGYALECGKHLNAAKADVGNGKWKKWCGEKLKVSEETERLYRRLAEALAKKPDVFASCNSIRKAMEELAKYNLKDMTLKPPRPPRPTSAQSGNGVTALQPPEADTSSGLKAELENAAADEIIVSIDADKLEEVAKASIAKLSPDKVCDAIIGAFSPSQIADLTRRLNDHVLRQPKATAVPPPPPELHRRPLAQPTLS